jgi:hypothetical protein
LTRHVDCYRYTPSVLFCACREKETAKRRDGGGRCVRVLMLEVTGICHVMSK